MTVSFRLWLGHGHKWRGHMLNDEAYRSIDAERCMSARASLRSMEISQFHVSYDAQRSVLVATRFARGS